MIRWLILTAAIMMASYLIDGIEVDGFFSAFFAAAILGILNAFFRPILIILTLPITILTLGLFTFVINALLLKFASGLISGFEVYGFWAAILGSLVISVVNWLLSSFVNSQGKIEYTRFQQKKGDYIDLKKTDNNRWE
ncbi:MAG: phage holin family protein [Pseudomonadota bacterium]